MYLSRLVQFSEFYLHSEDKPDLPVDRPENAFDILQPRQLV